MLSRRNFLKVAASSAISAGLMSTLPEIAFGTSTPSVYWGAYINGSTYGDNPATGQTYGDCPWDAATWDMFESHAGKKVSILHWGQPWSWSTGWAHGYVPFDPRLMDSVRSRGVIPMMDWGSWDLSANGSTNQPDYSLASIINGAHDAYLQKFAADAKAWGNPFFLRFDWEMNGNWYPWSEGVNGNTPGQFAQAWRHVHDIFTAAGANNVTWVWCPNIDSIAHIATWAGLYPGDAYVDWTGLDAYNKDPNNWASFQTVMSGAGSTWLANSYQALLSLAPNKPVMLAETASLEAGDGGARKAAWTRDMLATQLPVNFPAIKAVVWFNWNCEPGSSFVIESTPAAQSAFAAGIGSSYYADNSFGSLPAGTKVPPLKSSSGAGSGTSGAGPFKLFLPLALKS